MRPILPTVLVVLAALSCDPSLSRRQRGVQEEVLRNRVTAWARYVNNQALDSLAWFYDNTPELISTWPNGERLTGWDAERAALRDMFRDVATLNLVIQDPTVRVLDWGAAVVTFRFSMDQVMESVARDVFSGHGTQVWIRDRENAEWRILVSQASRTPQGPTARMLQP